MTQEYRNKVIDECALVAEQTAQRFEKSANGDPWVSEVMQGARHAAAEIRALKSSTPATL